MPTRRSARARPKLPERQLRFVDDDEEVGRVDLEIPQQLANRLAAVVHEREWLGDDRVAVAPPGHQRVGRRRFERDGRAARHFVDHVEADVVPRAAVLRTRIA